MNQPLTVGSRVEMHGGYDMEPRWLKQRARHFGRVIEFIPGQNKSPSAVVELDEPITVEGVTGMYAVLSLRYEGASWGPTETVHVELCDFIPEAVAIAARRHGKWVESHATYCTVELSKSGS